MVPAQAMSGPALLMFPIPSHQRAKQRVQHMQVGQKRNRAKMPQPICSGPPHRCNEEQMRRAPAARWRASARTSILRRSMNAGPDSLVASLMRRAASLSPSARMIAPFRSCGPEPFICSRLVGCGQLLGAGME